VCVCARVQACAFSRPVAAKVKGKGKAIPIQARTDPAGSRGFRLPDFMTIGT